MCACTEHAQTKRVYAFFQYNDNGQFVLALFFYWLDSRKKITTTTTSSPPTTTTTPKNNKIIVIAAKVWKIKCVVHESKLLCCYAYGFLFSYCLWKWAEARRHLFSKTYTIDWKILNVVRFLVVAIDFFFSPFFFEYKIFWLNALAFQLCISMADIKPQKPL